MVRTRCVGLVVAVALSILSLFGSVDGGAGVRAQAAGFDCSAPAEGDATTAASETSEASSAPMAEVAFPEGGGELTVFAAASLTDAFEEVKADLEAAHPGLTILYNFAGSQALVTQINEGAAADVFASANTSQMDAAAENGSIAGEPVIFVHNELVIVTPADNPAGIDEPVDLGEEGLRLVLAQAEVPVGRYARESVCKMAADTATFGENFDARVAANVVSEEEDVRDVLTKVQLGEADAGIVYVSDAYVVGDEIQRIEIPDALNVIADYPIATVTGGDDALGQAFISYILSEEGQTTLAEYGFSPAA